MGRILLIRHAEHPWSRQALVGRDEASVHLSPAGAAQARSLARALANEGVDCLQSSPRLRCLETAAPIADALELPVVVEPALDELDFGAWTGLSFEALRHDPAWRMWNSARGRSRPPGGETMAEALARVERHIDSMACRYPSRTIAMVTHAEIIRAVELNRAGLSMDDWESVDVPLASITRLGTAPLPPRPEALLELAAS